MAPPVAVRVRARVSMVRVRVLGGEGALIPRQAPQEAPAVS